MGNYSTDIPIRLLKICNWVILFSLLATAVYSQQYTALVLDSVTLEPIPGYNVDCGKRFNFGNEQGIFQMDTSSKCTISCIGYHPKKVIIDSRTDTIFLRPKVKDLEEVTIKASRNTATQRVGPIDAFQLFPKSCTIHESHHKGSILLYIPNEDSLSGKIKEILIPLRKKCDFLRYRIRLLSVNSYFRPSGFLLNSDIVLTGDELEEHIDIAKYNIDFPKQGVFISFDWYLPENKNGQNQDLDENAPLETDCLSIPMAKNAENPRVYVRFGNTETYKRTEKEEKLGGFIFVPKWGLEIIETE